MTASQHSTAQHNTTLHYVPMLALVNNLLPNCLLLCYSCRHCQCRSGKHLIVFLEKGPFILVMASATNEPEPALVGQLSLVHAQILSILTNSVDKMFAKNPSYDVRRLLGKFSYMSCVCVCLLYDNNKCPPNTEPHHPIPNLSAPLHLPNCLTKVYFAVPFLACPALPCPTLPCLALPCPDLPMTHTFQRWVSWGCMIG